MAVPLRIAAERYFSRAYMERERELLWPRVWLLGAHSSALPAPGAFVTTEMGQESILLVRQESGRVRAFFNVCQHRGNQLCPAETGQVRSFQCSYHHWEWHIDGSLKRMFRPESFGGKESCGELGLAEIACEERCGFAWFHMGERPEPIDDYLGPIAALVNAYQPARFWPRGDTTCEIPCNWKLSSDVSNEGYHVATLHPELLQILDEPASTLRLLGRHSHIVVPTGVPTGEATRKSPPSDSLLQFMKYVGVDIDAYRGTAGEARPVMKQAIRARAEKDGVDLSALTDDQLVDKHQFYVFPNVQLNFFPRRLEVYRHRPHPTDPTLTYFDEQSYELLPPSQPCPPRPKHVRFRAGEQSMGPVMGADVALLPGLQKGMQSRGFRGLLLGAEEAAIRNMHETLDRYLEETP